MKEKVQTVFEFLSAGLPRFEIYQPKETVVILTSKNLINGFVILSLLIAVGLLVWKVPTLQVRSHRQAWLDRHYQAAPPDREALARFDREIYALENEIRADYTQLSGVFLLLVILSLNRLRQSDEERRSRFDNSKNYDKESLNKLLGEAGALSVNDFSQLEHIARRTEQNHWVVIEALCVFIRAATSKKRPESSSEEAAKDRAGCRNDETIQQVSPDVQAALNIIRRRKWIAGEAAEINLEKAGLSGADLSGAYLERASLSGADLRGADLSGTYLAQANLSGADLRGADLTGACLQSAVLDGADLRGADLRGVGLASAKLDGAALQGACLLDQGDEFSANGASLAGVNLPGVDLSRQYISRVDLSGANLSGANLSRASLMRVSFTNANLVGADLSDAYAPADYCGASLNKAILRKAVLHNANFSQASLCEADLDGAELDGAVLKGASLTGANLCHADLTKADLSGADLTKADLSGADLTDAVLKGTDLTGADLSRADLQGAISDDETRFPEGFDHSRLRSTRTVCGSG